MRDREDAPSTFFLYRRANEGDRAALEQLLERMRPRVEMWVALHMGPALKARMDAEDLVQEILLKASQSIESFEPKGRGSFLGWLFTVARNEVRDWQRHHGAAKRDLRRERELQSAIPGSATGPLSRAERNEEMDGLLAALATLSERHRDILRLRRLEYLDNAEAAEQLGISRRNASVLYVRAMQALRERTSGS